MDLYDYELQELTPDNPTGFCYECQIILVDDERCGCEG